MAPQTGERTPAPTGAGGAAPVPAPPVPAAAAPTVEVDLTQVAVQVRDKLSYGLFDWAVTDADATSALALLGTVPPEQLSQELELVGDDHVARLLDNLPDSARTGPAYQRLVQTAGASAILAHSTDLLSRSLFDLVVSDTDVDHFFTVFTLRTPAEQEQLFTALLVADRLDTLFANATAGHHERFVRPWLAKLPRRALTATQRAIVRTIVEEDAPIETVRLAVDVRFGLELVTPAAGDAEGRTWTADSLRSTYLALDPLPETHVRDNPALQNLRQFEREPKNLDANRTSTVGGRFDPGDKQLSVNTRSPDTRGNVVHETGHAVDAAMRWRRTHAEESRFGGWTEYPIMAAAAAMIAESAGGIAALDAAKRADVEKAMLIAMARRKADSVEDSIVAYPWFAGLPAPAKRAVRNDDALEALPVGLDMPWINRSDGGVLLGGKHVYQESYERQWVRYEHAARERRVSDYQFRGPGEWFAEAYYYYYFYYAPGLRSRLVEKDPNTAAYFATDVDTFRPAP